MVTVLFADISGFTAMLAQMDPEQARTLINGCFDRLVPVVQHYGGVVDKFIGDEIMVLFGAPTAHEDDAERAMRAALELMETMEAFNRQQGTTMRLHIGINTGLVFAGGIGSQGRQSYTVMGEAVNLAARLEELSEAGEILVGPDSYRFTTPLFEFVPLPPVEIKGKTEPVPVYRLLAPKERPGRTRGLAGLESPIVGRDTELATLLQQGRAVREGQGGVITIVGEPGVGKSRLVAEWRAAARAPRGGEDQLRWAEGRCLSYGQGLAYHLLIDLLRSLLGVPATAGEARTHQALLTTTQDLLGEAQWEVYPYLAHLLSLHLEGEALDQVRLLDPQALQWYYQSALRRLFQALSARAPLIVVLEDIHWADPSSVELLSNLLPLGARLPLLFCLVSRPDEGVPGRHLLTAARERTDDALTELHLETLSAADSRRLMANLLEIEALPEPARALILERAEGNPLFVEEIIRMLIDRGAIVQEGDRWAAGAEIAAEEIPDNLQSLLLARIDRLPDDVKHTLRVAAVIGRQFSVRVLEEVLRGMDQ